MENSTRTILVVSAHAADFVWRAGGAIALYASRGYKVRILCLSYGERGESQGAWKQPGMTIERVKEIRRAEATRAAEILGAEVRFFDAGDYPLQASEETIQEMVTEFRLNQPEFVLTHAPLDPHNYDHPEASSITVRSRVYAQALGYPAPGKAIGAPPVFFFEPNQPGNRQSHRGLRQRGSGLRRGAGPARRRHCGRRGWRGRGTSLAAVEVARLGAERRAREERSRARLKSGELGLDIYGLRGKLAELGVQWVESEESLG